MNSRVAAYTATCEALAAKVSRLPSAIQVGAEYDDLNQEGLIQVWQSLERGVHPSADMIENRMIDWVRHLGAQIGRGRGELVTYERALPLDDFQVERVSLQRDDPISEPDGAR